MKTQLLIPAAGFGTRLQKREDHDLFPKALIDLDGKTLLAITLERLCRIEWAKPPVVIIPPGYESSFRDALDAAFPGNEFTLVEGGPERQDSVENGLAALAADTEIVVIHDAARPFVPLESVQESIEAAAALGAATVAIHSIDTILCADTEAMLQDTPDRRTLWACQTPQTFRVDIIRKAHAQARRDQRSATDDATLVRRMGYPVKLVMGSPVNFKVTTPVDLALARCVVREGLA